MKNPTGKLANWNPGPGSTKPMDGVSKLMSTDARDNPDAHNGTNELKEFVGKSGRPKGPFGLQGKEF